jgi:hypothetical protein
LRTILCDNCTQEKLEEEEEEKADKIAESEGRPAPSDILFHDYSNETKKKSSSNSVILPPKTAVQRKIMDAAVVGDELVDVVEKIENGGVKKNFRHGVTNWKNDLHEEILNRMAAEDRSHNSMLSKTDSFWKTIADTSHLTDRNGDQLYEHFLEMKGAVK